MNWWELEQEEVITQEMLQQETFLVRAVVHIIKRMEVNMSDLTDKVDAALAVLANDTANFGAALDTAKAATAVVQGELDKSLAQEAVDSAELQKAVDALNAAHAALGGTVTPVPVPPVPPVPPVV